MPLPFGLQPWHLIVIVVVALIIFGPSRLPDMGRSIGKAITEFRRGTREMTETFKEEVSKPVDEPQGGMPAQAAPPPIQSQPIVPSTSGASVPADAPTSGGNFCTSCGAPNPEGAKFCNKCGAQIQA